MKEYINRLAKGNFTYNLADIEISEKNILKEIVKDSVKEYEFTISSTDYVKGLVYSSDSRVELIDKSFGGKNNIIRYKINTQGNMPQDSITGNFDIVSSAGEIQVNYEFKIIDKSCETSIGKAYNLFHFANLVQTAPKEAEELFVSEEFKNIFINNDEGLINIYNTLSGSSNVTEAIEEFLIAARKKSVVTLSLEETVKEFNALEENTQEQLVITRNNWGHLTADVQWDVDFIEIDGMQNKRTVFTEDDFTGNRYVLEYVINKEKLHMGLNMGRIIIICNGQELHYEIIVHNTGMGNENRERKNAINGLIQEYLKYRMHRESIAEWMEKSNQILDRIRGFDNDNIFFKLAQAQVFIAQGRDEDAEWLVESVRDNVLECRDENIELYCYYLYVNSMSKKDKEYTKESLEIIKKYYDNGYDTWKILWILFYMDENEDNNKSIRLARIKDMYHNGCTSPIMYYEALSILNSTPVLLRVLNDFELQVINFGCRYDVIEEELADYICELIACEKVADIKCMSVLRKLNDQFDKDSMLTVLVTHMIRNELTGREYFNIYEKGILRGLRITRLYEFYMASIDKEKMNRLPKIVLMYFAYDSQLEYTTHAYLLANIIINESSNEEIMAAYSMQIEKFAFDQMRQRHINSNLAVIYRYVLEKNVVSDEIADFLCRFLFTYKITCYDEKCAYVVIKHREVSEPVKYPVYNKEAYVQMYSENAVVAFEDADGIRYKESIRYEIEKLYDNAELLSDVVNRCSNDIFMMIYRYRKNVYNRIHNETVLELCQELIVSEYIDQGFKSEVETWVINYYYEYYTGDAFKQRYSGIVKEGLTCADGQHLAEICIINEMYEDAFDLIKIYGYLAIPSIKIFKLARHLIEIYSFEKNDLIEELCKIAFQHRKYDEGILEYLEKYYNDSNQKMYQVWCACENFSVESQSLAERLVSQMLFTRVFSADSQKLFRTYYRRGAKTEIVKAYIAYHSYLYFVRLKKSDDDIYDIIEKYVDENNNIPEVCYAALLKHYSEDNVLSEMSDFQIHIAQGLLDEMCVQEKFFEFYKKLQGILTFPYNMVDKTIIEFRENPDMKVEINYKYNGEKFCTENMKCSVNGVFTKPFTLFYGDSLQYYFTFEKNGEIQRTEEYSYICNNLSDRQVEGRFDQINEMLASKELHDMATLKKLMYGYGVQNYVSAQLFKPM